MSSPRLLYHPFAPEDADELLSLFRDPEVRRYLLDDRMVSEGWVRDEIASSAERFATTGGGLWALRVRLNGIVSSGGNPGGRAGTRAGAAVRSRRDLPIVGFVGFREFFDPPRLQLLYGLLPTYWGRGLATEAARRIRDHAFTELGFGRIEAATDAPNEASSRVLLRLGMREVTTDHAEAGGTRFFVLERGP